MYSKEEKGSEISNRRGIEFNDFSLFCLFLCVFQMIWYCFEQPCFKKSCWWSGTSIKCAFLIVWLPSWIKNRISLVRGQDKRSPRTVFWRYQLVLLLLGGDFFLLNAAKFSLQKQLLLLPGKRQFRRNVLKCFPVVFGINSFQHPADTANAGTGQF